MKELSGIVASVNERMDSLEKLRERSIASSRSIIRLTKRTMHAIHSHEEHDIFLNKAISEFEELRSFVNEPEIMLSGPVNDAMAELAEACILSSVVLEKEIPSYSSLNVTPQAWVLGLADCLGEMRRILLDRLINNDIESAKEMFIHMDAVCEAVMSFDVPDAILPVRRKQDVARSIMERTRTDITNAVLMNKK
ncbi:MAG: RNA-binding protein [Methanomassiliicoccaceae archaeon]|nr:RNA-binding protein [Methanomassiliicoccaceae archaeon]